MRDDYIRDFAQFALERSWDADAVRALLARLPTATTMRSASSRRWAMAMKRALVPLCELLHSLKENEQSWACQAITAIECVAMPPRVRPPERRSSRRRLGAARRLTPRHRVRKFEQPAV